MTGDLSDPGRKLADCRVLVVEDNEVNRIVIIAFLKTAGITHFDIAADGAAGLVKVASFDPDLVILDLMMPGMDGHEFLRRLRADPTHDDLPVLVVTALVGAEQRNTVFDLGATDYVEKPVNGRELVARARIHLNNRLLLTSLSAYRNRLDQDLETLQVMQQTLLPSPGLIAEVGSRYGLEVTSYFEASRELGGDLWGIFPFDEHRLGLWIADFSGHGVAAAVNTFRLHVLLQRSGITLAHPPALLRDLNSALLGMLPRGQFATMSYILIDLEDEKITVASAGSPPVLVGNSRELTALAPRGVPLGITEEAVFETASVPFPKGSFIALFSDALIEQPDADGRVLEEDGLKELVHQTAASGMRYPPLSRLMTTFRGERPTPIDDDVTAVWVVR